MPNTPFRVEFEVVSWCNLDCAYCYAKPFSNYIPSLEETQYLLKKTNDEVHPFEVVFLGGEPFGRKDIVELMEYGDGLFKSGFGISTNGTLLSGLSKDQFKRIRNLRNQAGLQVSLDSIDAQINDCTRGQTQKTIKGLDMLEENQIQFTIGIVPTKLNAQDILPTFEFLLGKYRYMKSINLELLRPSPNINEQEFERILVSGEARQSLRNDLAGLIEKSNREDVVISGYTDVCSKFGKRTLIDSYQLGTCTAGLLRANVLANGSVTPCPLRREVILGNLYKESWQDIWIRAREKMLSTCNPDGQCFDSMLRREQKAKMLNAM